MPGRKPPVHSPETRARCLAALYASAEDVDGELVPNFHGTSRHVGVHNRTLQRWWAARDTTRDAEMRANAARARAEAAGAGARLWYQRVLARGQQRVEELLDDEARFKRASYDEAARGVATALKAAGDLAGQLDLRGDGEPTGGDGSGGGEAVDGRVRAALERARAGGSPAGPEGEVPP